MYLKTGFELEDGTGSLFRNAYNYILNELLENALSPCYSIIIMFVFTL